MNKKRKIDPRKEGHDAEIKAYNILKKLGFEIIYAPAKAKEERELTGATRIKKENQAELLQSHRLIEVQDELWKLGYTIQRGDAVQYSGPQYRCATCGYEAESASLIFSHHEKNNLPLYNYSTKQGHVIRDKSSRIKTGLDKVKLVPRFGGKIELAECPRCVKGTLVTESGERFCIKCGFVDLKHIIAEPTKDEKDRRDELISEWNKYNDQTNKKIDNGTKLRNLMTEILGKQTIPKTFKKAMIQREQESIEKDASNISFAEWRIEKIKNDEYYGYPYPAPTFVDIFCKKGKEYYCFDVKNRNFQSSSKLNNSFGFQTNEVVNYDRIEKTKKQGTVKIMIIIANGKDTFYRIFDWSDFVVPKKFNSDTASKLLVNVKLKDGLKLQTFTKF